MAVAAEPPRAAGKVLKVKARAVKATAGKSPKLTRSWSSQWPALPAPCRAASAATRLTPNACTFTWSAFMAWPCAPRVPRA